MKRRALISLLGAAAVAPRLALAKTDRPYRLFMVTWRGMTDVEKGFQDYMSRRHVPVEYVWRDAGQDPAKVAQFLLEVPQSKADLVYTWGTTATLGITGPFDKSIAPPLPVVFAQVTDPVAVKIVPRLRAQGRDVTGVFHVAPIPAQVEAIQAYRRFSKLGVIFNPAERQSLVVVADLRNEAKRRRIEVLEAPFATDAAGKPLADGIEDRIRRLKAAGAEWLYLPPDSFVFTHLNRVAEAAQQERLPTFGTTETLLGGRAPVLAGLFCRGREIGEFAAYKAEQILVSGKAAREVPIETLTRFTYVVRVEVAKALDILPPITLFNYAAFH